MLDGRELEPEVAQAAGLLATVTGQDLEPDAAGVFRIARRVAPDRVISTVDPEARHGHKTSARCFDGYKGHMARTPTLRSSPPPRSRRATAGTPRPPELLADLLPGDQDSAAAPGRRPGRGPALRGAGPAEVYADAAYGTGELLAGWTRPASMTVKCSRGRGERPVPQGPLHHRPGRPDGHLPGRGQRAHPPATGGGGAARFGAACRTCPLAAQCTTAKKAA